MEGGELIILLAMCDLPNQEILSLEDFSNCNASSTAKEHAS